MFFLQRHKQRLTLIVPVTSAILIRQVSSASTAKSAQNKVLLESAARVIPHPEKEKKGGEDAFFTHMRVLGVADGVGGWVTQGVDPSKFSQALVAGALESVENDEMEPKAVISAGHSAAKAIRGSATFCVVAVDADGVLKSANVGDSGYMVYRNDELVFRSEEQQHDFNFPFQLEGGPTFGMAGRDTAESADVHEMQLQVGDVVIVGSDGLFDNVFEETITNMVRVHRPISELADRLAHVAASNGANETLMSPFAMRARMHYGANVMLGGKLDDVTVVVARVVPFSHARLPQSSVYNGTVKSGGSVGVALLSSGGTELFTQDSVLLAGSFVLVGAFFMALRRHFMRRRR